MSLTSTSRQAKIDISSYDISRSIVQFVLTSLYAVFNGKNNGMDLYPWQYFYREDQLLQVQFWITRQDVQQLASVTGRLLLIGLIVSCKRWLLLIGWREVCQFLYSLAGITSDIVTGV
jgi:hypothetical protein